LITYIGNKRALLGFIGDNIRIAAEKITKKKLRVFDVFSGSVIVARYCKQFSSHLIVNDFEPYEETISYCYLSNKSAVDKIGLKDIYDVILQKLDDEPLRNGFITDHYAQSDKRV
jgi:adenine-specific DNA-methyltransferase